MDERKDARTDARTDGRTDGRTWATLNALPHSSNGGGITKRFDPSGARTPNLWYFKFRYEMLRLHAFWYDLFHLDAICQFMVTRSVTIESPVQIRSHMSEYGIFRSSTGLL